MGRKSKIEAHPRRKIIIKRLASGEEYSGIVRDYPDLKWDDLDYYVKNKLPEVLSKSDDLKAELEEDQGNDTLTDVRSLKAKAMEILTQAQGAGDLKTALLGIREARGCLETLLKAEGRIQEQNINLVQQNVLINNPEWTALQGRIVAALEAYPEAQEAVVNALSD